MNRANTPKNVMLGISLLEPFLLLEELLDLLDELPLLLLLLLLSFELSGLGLELLLDDARTAAITVKNANAFLVFIGVKFMLIYILNFRF